MMIELLDTPLWLWALSLFAFGATITGQVLTTTATTAAQALASVYTPTNTVSIKSTVVSGFLTTYSATESNLGTVYLRQAAVDKLEMRIQNTDLDTIAGVIVIPFGNGLSFTGSEIFSWYVTPAAVTSMRWTGCFFGQG